MRKSTDYSIGGASFLAIGLNMVFVRILSGYNGMADLALVLAYLPIGGAIVGVGAYWLWKAQGFYNMERKASASIVGSS